MKKRKIAILSVIMTAAVSLQASANSAPIRMYGYPSSAMMTIEESSPIEVEKEDLSFDLSEESGYRAKVTASYLMHNTDMGQVTSKMVFPYIGNLAAFSEERTVVSVDGQEIPYTLYIGETLRGETMDEREADAESFDIREAIDSLTAEEYRPRNFDPDAMGKTYRFKVTPNGEKRLNLNLSLKFTVDEQETKVFAYGFNGYGRNANQVELIGWMGEETQFEVHVQGEDVEIQVEAFTTDGVKTEKSVDFTYDLSVEEEGFGEYQDRLQASLPLMDKEKMGSSGLESLLLRALDEGLESMQGVTTENEAYAAVFEDRYLLLVYEVPFLANSRKTVEVSYSAEATTDRSATTVPTYTFTYLLSPAAHWKDFRNLQVDVKTSAHAPYMIGSSMEMVKTGDNVYQAKLASLPDEDLTFTLYHKPEITTQDRIEGALQSQFGYFYPMVLMTMFLLIGVTILVLIKAFRRSKRGRA